MTARISAGNTRPAKLNRISLVNCMSWGAQTIALHPGLNVIVGPSDSGKTNVYRAVRAIVENCPAKDLLTIGQDKGEAQVQFEDSQRTTVTLKKGLGKSPANEYDVAVFSPNPPGWSAKNYRQVGAECPQPVADVLRLGPVDLSGVEADLHFSAQRGPAFGVDAKPGDLAKMIGAVSGLDVVYRGLAQAETNRKAAQLESDRSEAAFNEARDKFRAAEAAFPRAESARLRKSIADVSRQHVEQSDLARELFLAAQRIESLNVDFSAMEGPIDKSDEILKRAERALEERRQCQQHALTLRACEVKIHQCYQEVEAAELSLRIATEALKGVEDRVHAVVGVSCPLCGRKGKP